MNVVNQIGGGTQTRLKHAILLYEQETIRKEGSHSHSNGPSQPVATIHPVVNGVIGAGVAASEDAVRKLAVDLLALSGGMKMQPSTVLAVGLDGMAWHCPPGQRQMWFAPHEPRKDDKEEKVNYPKLRKLTGETFPQPHLIFIATKRTFRVFALLGEGRPTEKSAVYRAPYWNVSNSGVLCIGSTRFPKNLTPALIPQYEAAFFKSEFTHPTVHGCKIAKDGHDQLWIRNVGKRRFPTAQLMRIPKLTVGGLLAHHHDEE